MKMVSEKIKHYYRKYRRYQMATYGDSGLHYAGKSMRQNTGGGAAYGCHAEAALHSAKAMIYFRAQLKKKVSR